MRAKLEQQKASGSFFGGKPLDSKMQILFVGCSVILLAGLILTLAGQPVRNLMGIAGIMILSASLAEVVRQRERFLEIFLDLFG